MASTAFDTLRDHIAAEYRSKGYSPALAAYIGESVAGRVAREQARSRRKRPPKPRRTRR